MTQKFLLLALLACAGCFYASEDDDLRTIPITNNPYVVPNHGGGIPGIGAPATSPQ